MKSDSEQFRSFLNDLPKTLKLDRIRTHWAKYAFHFTDIRNAASILTDGKIECRANRAEGSFVDAASPTVIAQTDDIVHSHVRLYFRPRTPTQYRSEGIRPIRNYWMNSHCPVPVFFLFDLYQLLIRDDCQFSDSNLAGRLGFDSLCSTADELQTFDFRKIYHDTWVSLEDKRNVVSHQNAEIVIPSDLDLSALKLIYCRSAAERETLLYLLPQSIKDLWSKKIAIATTATLFYRKWAFVEAVSLAAQQAVFRFSPDPEYPGPFTLRLVRHVGDPKEAIKNGYLANSTLSINFTEPLAKYNFELFLDDNLAFAGSFDERSEEQPF